MKKQPRNIHGGYMRESLQFSLTIHVQALIGWSFGALGYQITNVWQWPPGALPKIVTLTEAKQIKWRITESDTDTTAIILRGGRRGTHFLPLFPSVCSNRRISILVDLICKENGMMIGDDGKNRKFQQLRFIVRPLTRLQKIHRIYYIPRAIIQQLLSEKRYYYWTFSLTQRFSELSLFKLVKYTFCLPDTNLDFYLVSEFNL